jgi:hypothetical protein
MGSYQTEVYSPNCLERLSEKGVLGGGPVL